MKPWKGQTKRKIQDFKKKEREQIGQTGGEHDWWHGKSFSQNSHKLVIFMKPGKVTQQTCSHFSKSNTHK